MKTIVYIDGFNLCYGSLRRTAYKWLDLEALFHQLLGPDADILAINYYTAPIKTKATDDPDSPNRQQAYWRALKIHCPKVNIIQGKFQQQKTYARLVEPMSELKKVQVYKFEEKQTDVQIATDLLVDSWTKNIEQVVMCSNDVDLVPALAALRQHRPRLRVGLIAPVRKGERHIAVDLKKKAHWCKVVKDEPLTRSQLPAKIPHSNLYCPRSWQT